MYDFMKVTVFEDWQILVLKMVSFLYCRTTNYRL